MDNKFSIIDLVRRQAKALGFTSAVLALAGLFLLGRLPISLFPDITFPRITILADNGEQPSEVMMAEVTKPLEEVASSLPDIRLVRSITSRGSTEISIFLRWGCNVQQILQILQGRISDIRNQLPDGADIRAEQMRVSVFPVLAYSLTSDRRSLVELRDLAQYQVRPALLRVAGVSRVDITGGEALEFLVRCQPARMQNYGLTAAQVAEAISRTNRISAAGLIQDNYQIYLSLVSGRLSGPADISAVAVAVRNGAVITVGDVAEVGPAPADQMVRTTAHGRDAVLLDIIKQENGSVVQIGKDLEAALARMELPPDVRLENVYDQARFVRDSMASAAESILAGIVLAMLVIFLFLRSWRMMLILAVVVPATIASTVAVLYALGQTINIMTLGGIAAAVGLIIDDSIVVMESIFTHFRQLPPDRAGHSARFFQAARNSLREMTGAIVSSSASTLVIFIPLSFLGGVTGGFFRPLSLTMMAALVISFIFSITLTPLLASRLAGARDIEREIARHEKKGTGRFEFILGRLLRYRRLAIPAGLLMAGLTYFMYGRLESDFLPAMDEGSFILDYVSPPGTALAETDRMLRKVEQILLSVPEVETYARRMGTQMGFFLTEPNTGDYSVKLKPGRRRDIEAIIEDVRQKIEVSEPALHVEFIQFMQDVIGDLENNPSPIEIKIFGDDQALREAKAREATRLIETVPGVVDVFDGVVISGPVFTATVDPVRAAQAGFGPGEVQEALETMVQGTAGSKVQKGERLIPVRVRYPDSYRNNLEEFKQAKLINARGNAVPLDAVARFAVKPGQAEASREGLKPVVSVTARIEGRDLGGTIRDIQKKLGKEFRLPPGFSLEYGGIYQTQQESFKGLLAVALASLALVFIVLLFTFGEFSVPVSILAIILLSLSGVFAALWITGTSFNISSFVGAIMIIGIVAENAVFIIHYIHVFRKQGMGPDAAITRAVRVRVRPVLMTMLAAVFALLPLALGLGSGSHMQQPLAVAIIGGFSLSSLLLLFGLPVAYRLLRGDPEKAT